MKQSLKVLLIDDEALVRDELGGLLMDEGYQLMTAPDGESGLASFRDNAPDMVITDVRMPRRDGLSVAMTIRQQAPTTPITVITGHGNEAMVLEALRAGVTDFIKKPVRFEDLINALERMEAALRLARTQGADLPAAVSVKERTWVYELENDLSAIPLFVDVLLREVGALAHPRVASELSLALRELLINAIEHGNLQLTYEEKSHALEIGNLSRIIEERRLQPTLKQRKTILRIARRGPSLSVRIIDEGNGFDWKSLPDPTEPSYLLAEHGRGVLLARLAVDELSYNEIGNEVTFTKLLPEA
ncbi:MAG TPA: response regulator [Polyangiaceae bacterium]|jgi:FixJ family two-component response regulator|nr:MAG: Transcriptional regulatory protein ZraR [Deltaproteobacteria bacterium ADurb.Bin207]HNS99578.1 response regulator [Polyangiaceae bacterium]HNZ23964.1 response regulator [Polyangiaceae bacterium]HOD21785.1 response regulator [Polyangiaceae bacterium]HOE49495.1 response regulator [Polyangiaceae bacterium]